MEEEEREWTGEEQQDPLVDPDERSHLMDVVDSFRQYRRREHFNVTHVRRQAFYALPQAHWQRLAAPPISFLDTLCKVDDAIADNALIAEAVHAVARASLGLPDDDHDDDNDDARPHTGTARSDSDAAGNHAKARSTIHQLYRDWSTEGAGERNAVFTPVFADLQAHAARQPAPTRPPQVLVPGAGLARLVFELSLAGYAAEGNEISYHQLLASALILNHADRANQWTLHPFAAQFSNTRARADQLRAIPVPDICPAHALAAAAARAGPMRMCAGDFCDVYGPQGSRAGAFDAVATVFFIDTAPDLIRYIETVRHCLRVGGIWSNVGPLLWHFEPPPSSASGSRGDGSNEARDAADGTEDEGRKPGRRARIGEHGSVQLAHDEVVQLVEQLGFRMLRVAADDAITTGYIANERSLLESAYKPVHWVAERVA